MVPSDYEERAERNWAVYFYFAFATNHGSPQVLTTRLFPTMDRAKITYRDHCKDIFRSPEELAYRYDGVKLMAAYRTLRLAVAARTSLAEGAGGPHCEDLPDDLRFNRNEMSQRVWDLIQQVADRVHGITIQNDLDEDFFIIRLDRMMTETGLATIAAYNNQKRIVANALMELGESKLAELEITKMMRDLVTYGKLKTKQDPMRIFRYYAPELGDDGFVYYPTKRHKTEDHALNA